MQLALTVWEGRISPLFDATRMLLIVQIDGGRVVSKRCEQFDCRSAFSRAVRLHHWGVNVLICGGISNGYANTIEALGIQIIPFSSGMADSVLEAYLNGTISRKEFRMPGCEGIWSAYSPVKCVQNHNKEGTIMKIAVTASGPTLGDSVEARFGRCPYFVIVDSDSMSFEAIHNPNVSLGGGAGPQSAQLMAERGVGVVLTGNCGPNAFSAFGAAGIEVITGVSGRVQDAVAQYKTGGLKPTGNATVQSHYGMGGGGRGMGGGGMGGGGRGVGGGGRGVGGGRGMGGGGRGMGGGGLFQSPMVGAGPNTIVESDVSPSTVTGQEEKADVEQLKQTVKTLRAQIEMLEARLNEGET